MVGIALGYPFAHSLIAGTGLMLTSTAIIMQMLDDSNDISARKGKRMVSILLLEDLAIVPLLALAAFLAPGAPDLTMLDRALGVGVGLGAILALILCKPLPAQPCLCHPRSRLRA